jgi:hypothetical protein
MATADAAPCRHAGAPPDEVIGRVADVIHFLSGDVEFLARKGVTVDEYERALPAAIEKLRGSQAASNTERRSFLESLFAELVTRGTILRFEAPRYGDDTVYRLSVPRIGSVAIIQKGCPDGAHSSVRWSRPDWASEAYLWWLCSSMVYEPGTHVWKGVNRLRGRFFSEAPDTIDGIIFHNEMCGSPSRPCPKSSYSIKVGGRSVPPPCVYVMPQRDPGARNLNWDGARVLHFPRLLQQAFGIPGDRVAEFVGHVGFQRRGSELRTTVSSHFGPGRATSHRS